MPVTISIKVAEGETPKRIDVYLTRCIENATRTKVQQAIDEGAVLVNGKPTKASHKVIGGEFIQITLPKDPPPEVVPENIPLDIIYEDKFLLIVNKPAGMVVHPAYGNYSGTLVNALLYYYNSLSSLNDVTRPGIVHRIDKNTTGLLVVAKDNFTHAFLAKQFAAHSIEREYRAIVWGIFPSVKKRNEHTQVKSGIIEASLGRSSQDIKKMIVRADGKHAVTEYFVLEEFEFLTFLRLQLQTGRTHQIRTHLHHIGYPIFGDAEYGGRKITGTAATSKRVAEVNNLLEIMKRQALHAKTLGFIHPATKQYVRFDTPLPFDIEEVLAKQRRKIS